MIATERALTRPTVIRYAIGSLGTGGFSTLPGLVLVYYLTDTLGVAALAAGILVTAAKVWDVIIDPVVGSISDRGLAKHGTRRRMMLVGSATIPVFFILTFAVPAAVGPVAGGFWVLLAFLLTATSFSMFQVPYIALPAELTSGYDQRTRLLTWRVVVLTVAILLFGAGGPALRAMGGTEYAGYLLMAIVAGLVIGVGLFVSSFVAPRHPPSADLPPAPRLSIRANYASGIAALRVSQPFRALLTTFLLQGLAAGVMLAGANYVATYVLHSEDAVTFLFVALIGPALVITPVWAAISRRIGKERGFLAASILFGAAALSMVLLIWVPGEWVYVSVAAVGAGYSGMQSLPLAMLPDVISHDARDNGSGRAGIFGGMWTAGETTGMALGAAVLSIVLAATGYVASAGGGTVEQSATAVAGIVLSFSAVPAGIVAISLIPLTRYRLRRETSMFARDPQEILARLSELRARDAPTHGGRVLSYVYDSGLADLDDLAAAAIRAVQPVNGLDPTVFTSVAVMEREVVGFARGMLGGGEDAVGTVTTGGTESCLLAVKTARDLWAARGGTGQPRLVAPVTVHAAFRKAAAYFGIDLDLVSVDAVTGAVSAEDMSARLGEDVALVVVSAPSYPYAGLDPVAPVAAACHDAGVSCHVDACLGGWVLPFWPDAVEPWDFRVRGVTSVSADVHKYGYAPKGASVLLQRGRDRQRMQYFAASDWPGYPVINPTMLGSRSAGPLAAAWAIVQALGHDGFARLAASCARSTRTLVDLVCSIEGLRVVGEPVGPLFAVATDDTVPAERRVDPHHWADAVRARGWVLQMQPGHRQPDGTRLQHTAHLTITPVTESQIDQLAEALVAGADEVRGAPQATAQALTSALAERLSDAGELDSETAYGILREAGLGGTDAGGPLPERMAPVMALVEELPHPVTDRLLTELLARTLEPPAVAGS